MAFHHHAIDGDFVTGHYAQPVTDLHLVQGHDVIATRSDLTSSWWREVEECGDRTASATTGAQFQHLSKQHQHHDHGGGLEVDGDLTVVLHGLWE